MDLKKALTILKKHGYKYTDKRELMLNIFQKEGRYVTAKEILDNMQLEFPSLSFDTVYRNISLFEKLGILEGTEWDGERRYRIHCDNDHHHHIICTECGKTRVLHVCPMNGILGKPEDFEITGHKFEIYGRCVDCSGNKKQVQV